MGGRAEGVGGGGYSATRSSDLKVANPEVGKLGCKTRGVVMCLN